MKVDDVREFKMSIPWNILWCAEMRTTCRTTWYQISYALAALNRRRFFPSPRSLPRNMGFIGICRSVHTALRPRLISEWVTKTFCVRYWTLNIGFCIIFWIGPGALRTLLRNIRRLLRLGKKIGQFSVARASNWKPSNRVATFEFCQNSLTFPWHFPDNTTLFPDNFFIFQFVKERLLTVINANSPSHMIFEMQKG